MFQPRNIVSADTETHSYFPAFDYLRAAAALGVFLSHSEARSLFPEEIGNACVQVFFALSGFLIGGILLKAKPADLPRFYFNRSTRIWIPYWIAFALVLVVTTIKQGLSDPKFFEFFFYELTFVYNWFGPPQLAQFVHRMPLDGASNHFWSICVEEQFYLFAPFALLFLPRMAMTAGLVAMVAVNFMAPHYFAAISLGVLLAVSQERRFYLGAAFAAIAAGCAIALPYSAWMPFLAAAIVAGSSFAGLQTRAGPIVGGASYPFYLNSWLALFVGSALERKFGVPTAAGFTIEILIACSMAVGHYWFIDRTLAAKRGLIYTPAVGKLCCAAGICLVAVGVAGGLVLR